MGCAPSKEEFLKEKKAAELELEELAAGLAAFMPTGGPLTAKDYKERLVSSGGTQTYDLPHSGYTIRYAFVSQRGFYPDAPDKPNQDSFCVHTCFSNDAEQLLFGVFDGHGEQGHTCSQFAKDKVPENLQHNSHFAVSPEIAFHQAMVLTNNQLHRSDVDDTMSGTTAINLLIRGKSVYVANVGDSRAVLAEREGDRLIAHDLSFDQTPFRRDECERVKRCGARVLTLDQLEGLKDPTVECWTTEEEDDGDPPRLWAPNGMYPGTAFTRSIGDSAAERIGVFAEPEIVTKPLTASYPFLIVASDGVFEFLPSQSVVDMVSKFDDPQEACYSVVAESYRLWLQYDSRTDDITMLVIQIVGLEDEAPQLAMPTPIGAPWEYSQKTTSAKALVPRRHAPIELGSDQDDDKQPQLDTSQQERWSQQELNMLEAAVKGNFIFSQMDAAHRKMMFDAMEKRYVQAGEVVTRQGERGDYFYVAASGQYDVYVAKPDAAPELVHTYTAVGGQYPCFGELALLYGKPRAATVVARTDGVLLQLHRQACKTVLQSQDPQTTLKILRTVEVLQPLETGKLQQLISCFQEVTYQPGEHIIRQAEYGKDFYIIQTGEVLCTVRKDPTNQQEVPKEVLRLSAGQYFGERALLTNARRAANVVAAGEVSLLRLSREQLEAEAGPLQALLDAEQTWRDSLPVQRDAVQRKFASSINNQTALTFDELRSSGVLYSTDCSVMMLMHYKPADAILTVRLVSVVDATALQRQKQILRAREVCRIVQPSLFVPPVAKVFKDDRVLGEILMTSGLCTVDVLLQQGPLDEASAQFAAASVLLGLEHLHFSGVVYRGLAADTVLVTETGHLQLVDMRFAYKNEGRTYTMCGSPDYIAPEMIDGTGHGQAVDWWALGVFIYYLLAGELPFTAEGDDELRIFRKISSRCFTFPPSFSSTARNLVDRLLAREPKKRLGATPGGLQAIKDHPWFSQINWEQLAQQKLSPPSGIRERIYNFEALPYAVCDPAPCEGDLSWTSAF